MSTRRIVVVAAAALCVSALARAQDPTEPITNWTAPPYWTMPAGGQLREHLSRTEASPENQGVSAESASSTSPILPFTAITPCRLVDTRQSPDTPYLDNGGAGETRTYHFNTTSYYSGTGACGVIAAAAALSLSVQFQVTDHQASLIAYPDDVTRPLVASVVAYNTGLFYMNSAIVPTGADYGIKVFAQWGGQVVININGYYAPSNIVTTLNTLTGALTLAEGSNIDITASGGNTLTISMTGVSGGTLPAGTAGQTLRSNGSGWLANSALINDGTNVGISGNLLLPATTSGGAAGVVLLGGNSFLHNYGPANGYNTFVGQGAGNFTMGGVNSWEGKSNTAIGSQSFSSNTTGFENTASGWRSLQLNTTGFYNTATGTGSLNSNTTGSNNTGCGYRTLNLNTTGDFNTAAGSESLFNNSTASNNTATGYQSLYSNTTGSDNTSSGYQSLNANTTASKNTALGSGALLTQSFSNSNSTWDSENTAVGFDALYANQPTATDNGVRNTAVGSQSLSSNTTGSTNTAIGSRSLISDITGSYNTAIGDRSLFSNIGGLQNIALGLSAGYYTTGSFNIDIGNYGVAAEAGTIRIGDSNYQTRTFIAGIRGKTTGQTDAVTVLIDSAGQLGTVSSSIRFKQDVADMGDASSRLLDLRPVTFRYKAQPDGPRHFGLIAEEVNEVMPELVVHDATGQPETVAYHELPAMLLNELQKQRASIQAQMTDQAKTIQAQQARIEGQQAEIAAQKAEIDSLKATAAERDAKLAQIDILAARLAVLEARRTAK